jgi:hypothetical protein
VYTALINKRAPRNRHLAVIRGGSKKMAEKAIDSTAKILRKIQAELVEFRGEVKAGFADVNERLDKLEEHIAAAAAIAFEGRGIAERLKERVKRLEDRRQ